MIQPFGQQALGFGQAALNGQVPSQFLKPLMDSLGSSFGQSRQNLAEALGRSGQSGSGISAGPLANMENDQAVAAGNARSQALLQALGIGFQGSNALQGQQAIFDPNAAANSGANAGQTVIQAPGGFGQQLLGGLIAGGAQVGAAFAGKPGCWVAAELYGGWFAHETCAIRNWIWATWWMRPFAWFYMRFGQRWARAIKEHLWLRKPTKVLFDFFLRLADG